MQFKTYIYGRTLNIDFREICVPEQGISQTSASLVRELLNTDVPSNGDINRFRYLFARERNQVLFGIGFTHSQLLDESMWTDLSGRRSVRSFVGIVIASDEFEKLHSLPISPEFFKELYLQYVSDIWSLEDRSRNRKVILSELSNIDPEDNWCPLDGDVDFNSANEICRFFSPGYEDRVLHSLNKCTSAVLIGLNVESHVFTSFRRQDTIIPNAVCMDTNLKHEERLLSETPQPAPPVIHGDQTNRQRHEHNNGPMSWNWGNDNQYYSAEQPPKKALGLKLILLLVVALLMILLLLKRCR